MLTYKKFNKPNSGRHGNNRKEQASQIAVLEESQHLLAIDGEGDLRDGQVKATSNNVARFKCFIWISYSLFLTPCFQKNMFNINWCYKLLTGIFWHMCARKLTCPHVDSIISIRVQIISNAIASSVFSPSWIWNEAFSVGPTHSHCWWKVIGCLKLSDNYLKIPLFVHGRSFFHPNINIWPYAATKFIAYNIIYGMYFCYQIYISIRWMCW